MNKIDNAIHEIHRIDTIAASCQWVNQIHPLVKFIITIVYITAVISFDKYHIIGLAGMAVYPLLLFLLAELSFWDSLRRLRIVLPVVCLIGILNPLFDSAGVFSMITLIMKGTFCVLASYLLIATTTIERLCCAFRVLHVPKILVTQILLTYRYITVLLKETSRIMQAYSLRAPNQKGIHFKVWGSLAGQLLLRSIDRANSVYESMLLRGYTGNFQYAAVKLRWQDIAYFLILLAIVLLFRLVPVFLVVGRFFA